jgi:hypothetical protein
MLTEEQQTVLKELQKNQGNNTKAEADNRNRPHPYSGGQQRGVITKGECKACGVMGHWAWDDKCKTVDVQRKVTRDAAEQFQRQFGHPGGFASQQMHQFPAQYEYHVLRRPPDMRGWAAVWAECSRELSPDPRLRRVAERCSPLPTTIRGPPAVPEIDGTRGVVGKIPNRQQKQFFEILK